MTEHEKVQKREAELIKLIIIIAVFALLIVSTTFGIFFDFTPSKELKTWVDTATIFTGVATPILSTVSVFLLYFVWKDNRRELAATKQALIEQSDTQNFSVIKDAVFEIVEQIKLLSERKVVLVNYGREALLYEVGDESLDTLRPEDGDIKSTKYVIEDLLHDYFIWSKLEQVSNTPRTDSLKNLLLSDQFYDYIAKMNTLALFMQALKSDKYRQILEITLFNKLTIFTWLFFVEIAYHLFKYAEKENKETTELVFVEIAGLTCRQLKEVYWRDSLSQEITLELQKRNLI
ncbi:hypothetical protein CWC02_08425 [Pseudoalteromonas sp. S2721]|uniref:hypothetical protein n=1 Tax=Pseudoalteromonas sp. S2721 TaxID=579526 RepID=UPI00110B8BAA|nr:hypothetical protein [Pseudoalteromonas sp. S2721]TMP19082.1 hypothetical protein CWC02_08425 [Pseudoalteromonas sp. S2721]